MRIIICTGLLALLGAQPLYAQALDLSVERWDRADNETIRLPPSDFGDLPTSIREELERRNCTIPQAYGNRPLENVITGRFTSDSQVDIAVLCSRDRASSILVFRNGSTMSVDEIAPAADRGYLQGIGSGEIGFSRAIQSVTPQSIQMSYENWGGPTPPTMTHEGIADVFLGKGSVNWYWHEDHWLQLSGAD